MTSTVHERFDVTLAEAGHKVRPHGIAATSRKRFASNSVLLFGALIAIVWTGSELGIGNRSLVNGSGFTELGRFVAAGAHPRVSVELGKIVFSATLTTLAFAVLGTLCSVAIGLAFGVLSTRARHDGLGLSVVGKVIRILTIPIRGTHEYLWALVLVNILGLNPLVAVIAIALPFGAVSTCVFAEVFEAQPRGPFEALRASGATRTQAFLYGIVPGAGRDLSSYAFYRFECAIRAAAVLGIIGAAGLGHELKNSFDSIDYREMWTFLWPLIALSASADALSSFLRNSVKSMRRPALLLVSLLAAGAASWIHLHISLSTIWAPRARKEFGYVIDHWLPPDFSRQHLELLWPAARQTVAISVGSIIVSLAVAIPLSILTARASEHGRFRRAMSWVGRIGLLISRAIPPAVWAFLIVLVLFPGPLPAAVALGIYNAGVLGRLLAEAIENLDHRPRRALRASGARSLAATAYTTVPQAAPSFTTYTLYRWEVAMRETIVVGVAAAGGIGAHLKQILAAFAWNKVVASVIVLLLITAFVDLLSGLLRRRLVA
jgi:phosphonate transport system permease protein